MKRVEAQLGPKDFQLFRRLVDAWLKAVAILTTSRAMLSRLRRLFGVSSSEKSSAILRQPESESPAEGEPAATAEPAEAESSAPLAEGSGSSAGPGGDDASASADALAQEQPRKGHGRLPASVYRGATQVNVEHQGLKKGDHCPACKAGKLYELPERQQYIRIVGQPVLHATCWNCQRLRCSSCGDVHAARPPADAVGPKFDETAVAMIAVCRYGFGLPHNRLAKLQKLMQLPVPVSTQNDLMLEHATACEPVFAELERHAAQGTLIHEDDTYARVMAFMGRRRAELLKQGELSAPDRVGLFTTGIVSLVDEQPIVLFYTGRNYAGENLATLLGLRDDELPPPMLMSDGLESRNVPKGHVVDELNCLAHARRGFVDQLDNFPEQCRHVIEQLREVYRVDASCKKDGLSANERLARHQQLSAPIMLALKEWLDAELEQKRVEPNSELGKAFKYMLKRWPKLTVFLRQPGAAIDNNVCERALKMAIRHRRASLFYRSERGAEIGDLFMSLIYTAELRNENPFAYLTAILQNAKAVAEQPSDWLPWTYRDTLALRGQR